MKKGILALFLCLFVVSSVFLNQGCKSSNPAAVSTPQPTATATMVPGNYHFDSNLGGWMLNPALTGITSAVLNTSPLYVSAGAGSVQLTCDFTGQTYTATAAGELGYDYSAAPLNLTGKTVKVYVYSQGGITSLSPVYEIELYLKSPGLTKHGYVTNLITAGWASASYPMSLYTSGIDLTNITYVGFRITKSYSGSVSPDWSGTLYLDEVTW